MSELSDFDCSLTLLFRYVLFVFYALLCMMEGGAVPCSLTHARIHSLMSSLIRKFLPFLNAGELEAWCLEQCAGLSDGRYGLSNGIRRLDLHWKILPVRREISYNGKDVLEIRAWMKWMNYILVMGGRNKH